MKLETVYLILAVLGAALPLVFFANFAAAEGVNLLAFVEALFVNGATGGFTVDLVISSFVFWVYMYSKQADGPKPWAFIAINLCIGLSCALPAYLWAKQRSES